MKTKDQQFKEEMREIIIEWYANCPNALQFVSKTIKSYKENFPDDDFMKDLKSIKD